MLSNNTTFFRQATDGAYWISYREPIGASRFRVQSGKLTFENYSIARGLRSSAVYFLGTSLHNQVWVGTDSGVDLFDGKLWSHYGQAQGLIWNDCNNAFFPEVDGSVWMGTSRGLSHFSAEATRAAAPVPSVAITALRLGEKTRDIQQPIEVAYRDHRLRISFTSPTFLAERSVRFRYRLLGAQTEWTESAQREAEYPVCRLANTSLRSMPAMRTGTGARNQPVPISGSSLRGGRVGGSASLPYRPWRWQGGKSGFFAFVASLMSNNGWNMPSRRGHPN